MHAQEALAEAIERGGTTRARVARLCDLQRSNITRFLSSGQNLTLRSLAALLWACGFRLRLSLEPIGLVSNIAKQSIQERPGQGSRARREGGGSASSEPHAALRSGVGQSEQRHSKQSGSGPDRR